MKGPYQVFAASFVSRQFNHQPGCDINLGRVTTARQFPIARSANAIYHATGKRVRDLPITIDKLLRG